MEKNWRVIIDGVCDGYYNMAKDEAIFQSYPHYKIPTLRIYRWNEPFVTLGYFQEPKKVINTGAIVPYVRRITGGAAILHGNDLTYSLSLSAEDLELTGSVKESYRILTSFLIEFYRRCGLTADYAQSSLPQKHELGRYGTFCFSSFEQYDINVTGKKIGGNAQKRKKQLIFQQGSIPFFIDHVRLKKTIKDIPDNIAEHTTGLYGILKEYPPLTELHRRLVDAFRKTFSVSVEYGNLTPQEEELTQQLLTDKYLSGAWNLKRHAKTILVKQKD
ncbi:MAG: lipoate--protein ligase family protein [Candidatus Omnitrophica bacterium]|nr:lipoate--protein ligase family protein [Candidatus Omnitrophota bacterium]